MDAWRIIPGRTYVVRITPIYKPWNGHLENERCPILRGQQRSPWLFHHLLTSNWDDPPSSANLLGLWVNQTAPQFYDINSINQRPAIVGKKVKSRDYKNDRCNAA